MSHLKAVPQTQKQANQYVIQHHRHHGAVVGDIFRIGAVLDDELVGVVMVGRPVARMLDHGKICEVLRLCTNGASNVCSFLYSRAARVAKELGYDKIITYILDSETGGSLKASGWIKEADVKGHDWNCPSRPRNTAAPNCDKQRWAKIF
jgi:hypothetical protein